VKDFLFCAVDNLGKGDPMHEIPNTRLTLLVRLRDGNDQSAWSEFVSIYEQAINGFARKWGLQDADARDLCQEVMRSVAKAIEDWDPDPCKGQFRACLFRIARNLLINLVAHERRQPRGSGDSDVRKQIEQQPAAEPPDSIMFEMEYRRRLFHWAAQAIRQEFTESTWNAFWKTAVEDRKTMNVARELKISTGAVYIARLRARIDQVEGRISLFDV
jgi:RNA polymerase sigma factor (sigma-70 family)